jgi:putative sigma-54 modulation protein
MNVNVSYRHMESSPSLREYAVRKLERICDKYVRGKVDASVVLTAEPFGHVCDFKVSVRNSTVKGKAQSHDMYSSIDLALEKIEKQLRRRKERVREHTNGNGMSRPFTMGIVAPEDTWAESDDTEIIEEFAEDYEKFPAPEEDEEHFDGHEVVMTDEDGNSKVLRNREYSADPMSVEEAVEQLEEDTARSFFVFNNVDTDRICIVYRRDDEHIGLIETG